MAGIEIDYKELVLEIMERVREGKASDSMLELRLSLFVAASLSASHDRCLLPFPPCFFDRATKAKDFAGLQEKIALIPQLKDLNEKCKLPSIVWNLLYWVFTNPLNISPLINKDGRNSGLAGAIREKTGLQIPTGLDSGFYFVFEVTTPHPKPAFVEAKEKYGSYYAFHGSPLCNFHSIIHRGMLSCLNQRAAYGPGTYFSSAPEVSDHYSRGGLGWDKSRFGRQMRCMAICEIVKAPEEEGLKMIGKPVRFFAAPGVGGGNQLATALSTHSTVISVLSNDDLVQMTYLLVFRVSD